MTRLKAAELTSGVGALVLSVGLGALFLQWFAPSAGEIKDPIFAVLALIEKLGVEDTGAVEKTPQPRRTNDPVPVP